MYKTINGYTKESMKQKIREGNNGTKSENKSEFMCKYRSPDGNKCAVGCFIPDSIYKKTMDGPKNNKVGNILDDYPELKIFMPLNLDGLGQMQIVHDKANVTDIRDLLCDWIDKEVTE